MITVETYKSLQKKFQKTGTSFLENHHKKRNDLPCNDLYVSTVPNYE